MTLHEEVAEKIAESLGMRTIGFCSTPGHCDSTIQGHITAVLEAQYGGILAEALDIATEFCARVERGEVRSHYTYNRMLAFISHYADGTGRITEREA